MKDSKIYEDIANRTGGDIYLGIVGPVRTGKSTFIKRFMDTLVIPNIENVYVRERARDELPQSGSGRTIMTAEPKFVPEDAVEISPDGLQSLSVRLIDSVGYMIPGASGLFEGDSVRMVTTPWFDHEIPITEAAELGTKKVITDHSTIGIVITTDGTITDIPREDYIDAESRVISQLREIGKPFIVIINSAEPENCVGLARELTEKYGVSCIAKNCQTLTGEDITDIIGSVLAEFPLSEIEFSMPDWFTALDNTQKIKTELFEYILAEAENLSRIRDAKPFVSSLTSLETVSRSTITTIDMGCGVCKAELDIPRSYFYSTVSEGTGFSVENDSQLMELMREFAKIKSEYDRIAPALRDVNETGYGVILPDAGEMKLDEPEIVRKNGRYGVRLKASAPSIHLLKTDIATEVSPAVGGAGASEEIIGLLLQSFEGDTARLWESNLFGKSLYDIAGEELLAKITRFPKETQSKMRTTLEKIINDGSGSIICFIL